MIAKRASARTLCATVAALSVWLIGAPAAAQEEIIAACNALPTDAQRISCLSEALRLAGAAADIDPSDLPRSEPSPVVSEPAAPVAQPEPAREGRGLPFFGRGNQEAVVSPEEFGAERFAERRAPDAQVLNASVVSSDLFGFNQLEVELENGQVWRQVQAEKPWDMILDGEPSSVEIRQSRFGGYRMTVVGLGRTMSVERIR